MEWKKIVVANSNEIVAASKDCKAEKVVCLLFDYDSIVNGKASPVLTELVIASQLEGMTEIVDKKQSRPLRCVPVSLDLFTQVVSEIDEPNELKSKFASDVHWSLHTVCFDGDRQTCVKVDQNGRSG